MIVMVIMAVVTTFISILILIIIVIIIRVARPRTNPILVAIGAKTCDLHSIHCVVIVNHIGCDAHLKSPGDINVWILVFQSNVHEMKNRGREKGGWAQYTRQSSALSTQTEMTAS